MKANKKLLIVLFLCFSPLVMGELPENTETKLPEDQESKLLEGSKELEQINNKLINAVTDFDTIQKKVRETGKIDIPCKNKFNKEVKKIYFLKSDKLKIDNPYYVKTDRPYIIWLRRSEETPKKVRLEFGNGHRVCGKFVIYTGYNGSLSGDCLFYINQYEENVIDIDLSQLTKLNPGESDTIEISFSKPNVDNSKYQIEVNSVEKPEMKALQDNKFWLEGINLKLVEPKKP
jgi:hypothetical protein